MTVALPDELAGAYGLLDARWPSADEDALRALAGRLRLRGGERARVLAARLELCAALLEDGKRVLVEWAEEAEDAAGDLIRVTELRAAAGELADGLDALAAEAEEGPVRAAHALLDER